MSNEKKETKYTGYVAKVTSYPSKKSPAELPTVGLQYSRKQAERHVANVQKALDCGAESIKITVHRKTGHETCLYY